MKLDMCVVRDGLKNAGNVLIELSKTIDCDPDRDKLESIFIMLCIDSCEEEHLHLDVDKRYCVSEDDSCG